MAGGSNVALWPANVRQRAILKTLKATGAFRSGGLFFCCLGVSPRGLLLAFEESGASFDEQWGRVFKLNVPG